MTSAVKVRAIEKGSGNPVPGAHVIVFAQAKQGSVGDAGKYWNLFLAEGVTDGAGEVLFPSTFFVAPSALVASLRGPDLYIYKPGYQLASRGGDHMFPTAGAVSVWGQDLASVEMVPVANERDSILALRHAIYQAERGYIDVKTCEWAKIPNFLIALSSEAARLKAKGKSGTTDPKIALEISAIDEPVATITRR